jgi:hypothetical protein
MAWSLEFGFIVDGLEIKVNGLLRLAVQCTNHTTHDDSGLCMYSALDMSPSNRANKDIGE